MIPDTAYRYVIAIVIMVIFLFLIDLFLTFWFSRHQKNIRKARRVLNKIRSWDNDNINARIFGYLRKIDPFVFEELLLEAFKDKGYGIQRNSRYTGDGGIDGIVFDNTQITYLIQAKRYKGHINRQHLLDFQNLVTTNDVKGFFIHTGKTGKGCYSLLKENNVQIISGSKLIKLLMTT